MVFGPLVLSGGKDISVRPVAGVGAPLDSHVIHLSDSVYLCHVIHLSDSVYLCHIIHLSDSVCLHHVIHLSDSVDLRHVIHLSDSVYLHHVISAGFNGSPWLVKIIVD